MRCMLLVILIQPGNLVVQPSDVLLRRVPGLLGGPQLLPQLLPARRLAGQRYALRYPRRRHGIVNLNCFQGLAAKRIRIFDARK